jgi:hypothetical protein
MRQPELDAAAAEGKGRDLFAAARAAHPHARLILLVDRRLGHENEQQMLAVEPGSDHAWDRCLPDEQLVEITAPDGNQRRE